jgi:hypothetical protein
MAVDTKKMQDDASNILKLLKKISPGSGVKKISEILQGNQSQIIKAIKQILKVNPTTAGATQAIEFVVDRYKLPESVAARLVANELTDANIPTDSSGSADEGFPSRPEFESSAEDTSVPPKRKRFPSLTREMIDELLKNRRYDDEGFPDYGEKRFPEKDRFYPPVPSNRRERELKPLNPFEDIEFPKPKPFNPNEPVDFKFLNQGGRVLKQTGGITETRTLPPEFIEAAQKTFLADLTRQAGLPTVTTANVQQPGETAEQFAARQAQAQQFGITRAGMAEVAPQVAAQDALQAAAYTQATDPTTGLGSFQPFLTKATTAADAATGLTGTGAGTGTGSIESYRSPFQQQVIDTTLAEFDRQAQIRRNQQAAATLTGVAGAFGGGREGVQRAEFDAASNRNRAALQAGLLQQSFENAAARRQQDLANQLSISQQQRGLGASAQDFSRAQISGLGTLGAAQQAQNQAILDAQRQAAQMAVDDPRRRLGLLGTGITSITPGAGGVTLQPEQMPAAPSPLTQALGFGLMGADIYGRIFRNQG